MNYKYQSIPTIKEAFQLTRATRKCNADWPQWMHKAWSKDSKEPGALYPTPDVSRKGTLSIMTLEGPHEVSFGDYIIQGIEGELYPCKPNIFEKSYQPLKSATPRPEQETFRIKVGLSSMPINISDIPPAIRQHIEDKISELEAAQCNIRPKEEHDVTGQEVGKQIAKPNKRKTGLYDKYRVERTDGQSAPGQKHHECEYFCLDMTHDKHASAALFAYAVSCSEEYPLLSKDLTRAAYNIARTVNPDGVVDVAISKTSDGQDDDEAWAKANRIQFSMDGNMWCAVAPSFVNLQESPAGFGQMIHDAILDLRINLGAEAGTELLESPVKWNGDADKPNAIEWDGNADTANNFIGEDFGSDWAYCTFEGSAAAIWVNPKAQKGLCANLHDMIVKKEDGLFEVLKREEFAKINESYDGPDLQLECTDGVAGAKTNDQFRTICKTIRRGAETRINQIDRVMQELRSTKDHYLPESDQGDMYRHLQLAKEHFEDARMRAGMAIKAWDGGESAYKD